MRGRNVERFEVVELILDLRPCDNFIAGTAEDLLDAQARLRDRVQAAGRLAAPGQRDVDRAGGQLLLDRRVRKLGAARVDRLQTSLNLALGSALASIGLTIPAVAALSIALVSVRAAVRSTRRSARATRRLNSGSLVSHARRTAAES